MQNILLLVAFSMSITAAAQLGTFAGTYNNRNELNDGCVIEYRLTLQPDGTFTFHNYRKLACSMCSEENQYGKGIWTSEKKELYFFTHTENDLDEVHTLDFTNTKARSNRKSPRNKLGIVFKESIRFYSSEIPWLKGWELFKN